MTVTRQKLIKKLRKVLSEEELLKLHDEIDDTFWGFSKHEFLDLLSEEIAKTQPDAFFDNTTTCNPL